MENPTTMSDKSVLSKREQRLEKIVDEIRSTGTLEGIGILQNFADQQNKLYLEKVLEEAEKEIEGKYPTKDGKLCYNEARVEACNWLLNHLKQKQKG